MAASQAPTGLARRGRRLTDQETEQRMLRAAVHLVSNTGLTVSLDHISLEDLIRAAGVSRSTVYRAGRTRICSSATSSRSLPGPPPPASWPMRSR